VIGAVVRTRIGRIVFPVVTGHAVSALPVKRNLGDADVLIAPIS
jgi:hypothetical protein